MMALDDLQGVGLATECRTYKEFKDVSDLVSVGK